MSEGVKEVSKTEKENETKSCLKKPRYPGFGFRLVRFKTKQMNEGEGHGH